LAHSETQQDFDGQKIHEVLTRLEARIDRLEKYLGFESVEEVASIEGQTDQSSPSPVSLPKSEYGDSSVEMTIGEYGLAWVGSIIFFLGIVFLMTYTFSLGYPILGSILGYISSAGLFFVARYWKDSLSHLSRITISSSLLLLFYTTMRLHFYTDKPLIGNAYQAFALLLVIVALQLYLALKSDSQSLTGLAVFLGMTTALLADRTHVTLTIVVINCAIAAYLMIRRDWWRLALTTLVLAYASHLLWLIGNPVLGHPIGAVTEHQYNVIYLFFYAAIFSLPVYFQKEPSSPSAVSIMLILLNCMGFSVVTFLVVLTHYSGNYAGIYLGVAGLFLAVSIIQWIRSHEQIAPSIYACLGFMALSIAIYGYTAVPTSFLWLSLQSLLVVSMALWFRSRILVVVNSLILASILLAYLVTAPTSHWVNFGFVVVAHTSARIMNWQKERLTLRTESLRNVYLFIAFSMVLYALFKVVPGQYVTLSWTLAAIGYFLFSYILRNIKYRLMAMGVLLATVTYLFLVDLARLAPQFRVAAFLFLGLMALLISFFYTRIRGMIRKDEN
jgi:hypothetical protein